MKTKSDKKIRQEIQCAFIKLERACNTADGLDIESTNTVEEIHIWIKENGTDADRYKANRMVEAYENKKGTDNLNTWASLAAAEGRKQPAEWTIDGIKQISCECLALLSDDSLEDIENIIIEEMKTIETAKSKEIKLLDNLRYYVRLHLSEK